MRRRLAVCCTLVLCCVLALLVSASAPAQGGPAAQSTPVGMGCSVTAFQPVLSVTPPVIGQPVTVGVFTSFGTTAGWLLASPGPPVLLPVSGGWHPSCAIFVDPATARLLMPFSTPSASWCQTLMVPPSPALAGQKLTVQALLLPPFAAPAGSSPTLTNAVEVTLGF